MISRKYMPILGAALFFLFLLVACGGDGDELQANAGDDFSVAVGESPTFDGCASNGDIANYRWVIVEAPSSMQDDVGKPLKEFATECSFTLEAAMISKELGSWVVELTVSDNAGNASDDAVSLEVAE